ncbi:MAG: helix-turn-helix domain-containing protein [Deltaproteobacteria bacterium]|nr:helix-turn-helix domain-containing protein [Deltaproteobacteria bacterium]
MIDVTVILLEGGLPSTSMAPLEIFACAGTLWGMLTGKPGEPRFRVRTATIDGKATENFVPVSLVPTMSLADVPKTDLVMVPTAGMDLEQARVRNARVIEWLKRRSRTSAVAGVCTGVSLLAAAGLLDGRPATTHWGVIDQCRVRYPNVQWNTERFVTEADNVFCGGGLYASIDLSLYLVERFCGHEVAVQTAKALLLETPRIWQSAYAAQPPRSAHDDEPVQRAQKWLFTNFREPIDLDGLAERVGMSPRNFARRFKAATGEAPLAYLHRLRIDTARHYLESAHKSVQDVSLEVGYEDVAFFRQLFRRHTGTSPREYRARFGPRRVA